MQKIIESKYIIDILQYVTPQSLVIFDIDNTLIEPVQTFGSHAWFMHIKKTFKKQGLPEKEAMMKASAALLRIQDDLSFKMVEPDTIRVIEILKNNAITTMAMTSRCANFARRTYDQLKLFNITFSPNFICNTHVRLGDISCWIEGILYTGDERSKGESIMLLFEKIAYIPQHVLFIDDSIGHIEHMYTTLRKKNIPALCIRYGATDERAAQFDPDKANKELLLSIGTKRYNALFTR